MRIRQYEESDAENWDQFCERAHAATFLHTRKFLSYHGNRFKDLSLLLEDNGKLVGLFPAALKPNDDQCVISHPGITYGGVLHQGKLKGEKMVNTLAAICQHYRSRGLTKLTYKAVPSIYHTTPAQDDIYALYRLNATLTRCDLSSCIDIENQLPLTERRRRNLKKATKAGVEIVEGTGHLAALWDVLVENLERKHGASPVHSVREITMLASRFPEQIGCVCAIINNKVEAGTLLFKTTTTHHLQYIASSELGYAVSALDLLLNTCISAAKNSHLKWLDFGISTEDQGLYLNSGLYKFKSEFGGGGIVHEFFDIDLNGGFGYAYQ